MFLQRNRSVVVMEMNHFCLDVLQRITLPDFLDFMRSVFPYLYAIDIDNTSIVDLHIPDKAYMVMHEHVVKHRFPNLVGGFDDAIKLKLEALVESAKDLGSRKLGAAAAIFKTPALSSPNGKIISVVPDAAVTVGELFEISVSIVNESEEIWHGYGEYPVYLCYHWKENGGNFVVYDGIRTELTKPDFAPSETIDQQISVKAPAVPGKFKLVLTLVQEGVCWFEDKGFEPAVLEVEVSNR